MNTKGVWVADLREYRTWPKSAQEIVYAMLESMGADRCYTIAITPTKIYAFCNDTDEYGKMYLDSDGEIATKLVVRERRQRNEDNF
jgi:hypothetical protein